MPANQLITQPRKETDLRILMADADTMPQTYYLRDVYLSQEVNMLHEKLRERAKKKANDPKATICIDMQTYKRYEFDSRTDCDHYFE